jgi:hypothetical protein
MGSAIRSMLHPVGKEFIPDENDNPVKYIDPNRSAIIDDQCAFLPITNLLTKLSEPPDTVMDVYTSSEGYAREQVAWIDSKPFNYGAYDLTATFRNIEGDPITAIFAVWTEYAARVLEGSMLPFPVNIIRNRIDYQTRFYRFVMDRTNTYIQKVFACGIAFPYTIPQGAQMGYDINRHLHQENDELQITFKCLGAMYDDPILLDEFNKVVGMFNPSMRPDPISGKIRGDMVKLQGKTVNGYYEKMLLNYKTYPYVNKDTKELEWYCPKDVYKAVIEPVSSLAAVAKGKLLNIPAGSPTLLSPWSNNIKPAPNYVKSNLSLAATPTNSPDTDPVKAGLAQPPKK